MIALPKNAQLWLPDYLRSMRRRPQVKASPIHVYFAVTDHFEPMWRNASLDLQRERVRAWVEKYPAIAARHRDSDGRPPLHSYFYPAEQYLPEHLEAVAGLCRRGFGDVEIHLHHDDDSAQGTRETLLRFAETLHTQHGLLRRDPATGKILYGFIHGNFALNNAHPSGKYCGVNDETSLLLDTGCYADFTLPSAPGPTQVRKVNSLYYAEPQSGPRGHETGGDVVAGKRPPDRALLMIQGPLNLNMSRRKWGVMPRIDNADLSADNPPEAGRVPLWIAPHIHVRGAPAHVFIKLSTHGAQDKILRNLLLDGGLDTMWTALERFCSEASRYRLHYVTAYEMFCKIKALEAATGQ